MFGKRILILIPHPDDEVVGAGAAIARARGQGARVFGAYLSHGCLSRDTLWRWQRGGYARRVARRMKEAERAADFLGITPVVMNTQRAAREIWRELPSVRDDVLKAMQNCAPDRIWVPAFEGGNPDHDALNALAYTLEGVPVFEFSEYHLAGGRAHSNRFIAEKTGEIVHRLKPEERRLKRQALNLYRSEKGNTAGLKLEQEQFRPLPCYDYSKPPHEGQRWYERFQWVPFHHPRVDYTKAEEVSSAITAFLQS
ncbi:MAG TPA: PIG-L family deacetylase [Alphaproteobacteria bacterium]|nr:PIG-L family deacetylase [Alphaproteobacteria bacterium]